MTGGNGTYRLRQLMLRYIALRVTETLCWSIAATAIVLSIMLVIRVDNSVQIVVAIVAFASAFGIQFVTKRLSKVDLSSITRYLDFNYSHLENSTDLLLLDRSSLHGLSRLQHDKVTASLEMLFPSVRFPHKLGHAAGACFLSILMLTASFLWNTTHRVQSGPNIAEVQSIPASKVLLPVGIKSLEVTVDAPEYTGIGQKTYTDPNLYIPEGSKVRWRIAFDRKIKSSALVVTNRDTIKMESAESTYSGSGRFSSSTFYRITWLTENDSVMTSDYYALDAIPDRPPQIETTSIKQFTELEDGQRSLIPVSAVLHDDYGLTESYLVATVAKGSGESVKFREERLRFDNPGKIRGKGLKVSRNLDLPQLGLEPGDELYFYIIAFDNRYPENNYSRTETFFVTIRDSINVDTGFDASLGVNLMPEYFRSQRQIIIDSERLLKEKAHLSRKAFNQRSNDLAHDQKILRLRYGQFLGEEFETGIVHENSDDHHDDEHEHEEDETDVTKKFGHVHDGDNEHNLLPDHNHVENSKTEKDPLEGFIHRHDDPEEATFFTQSIRAKLKATLAIMWDAELHLRLLDPAKSLPHQYKALKLLKEISNDSRVYVHKTGFDAPPIKEEKRLTGELDDARSTVDRYEAPNGKEFVPIHEALELVEIKIHSEHMHFTEQDKDILRKAGQKIAMVAVASPGKYLETLTLLQRITSESDAFSLTSFELEKIRESLIDVLPKKPEQITSGKSLLHRSDSLFLKNLFGK